MRSRRKRKSWGKWRKRTTILAIFSLIFPLTFGVGYAEGTIVLEIEAEEVVEEVLLEELVIEVAEEPIIEEVSPEIEAEQFLYEYMTEEIQAIQPTLTIVNGVADVSNWDEYLQAMMHPEASIINVTADITSVAGQGKGDQEFNRAVIIEGNGHLFTFLPDAGIRKMGSGADLTIRNTRFHRTGASIGPIFGGSGGRLTVDSVTVQDLVNNTGILVSNPGLDVVVRGSTTINGGNVLRSLVVDNHANFTIENRVYTGLDVHGGGIEVRSGANFDVRNVSGVTNPQPAIRLRGGNQSFTVSGSSARANISSATGNAAIELYGGGNTVQAINQGSLRIENTGGGRGISLNNQGAADHITVDGAFSSLFIYAEAESGIYGSGNPDLRLTAGDGTILTIINSAHNRASIDVGTLHVVTGDVYFLDLHNRERSGPVFPVANDSFWQITNMSLALWGRYDVDAGMTEKFFPNLTARIFGAHLKEVNSENQAFVEEWQARGGNQLNRFTTFGSERELTVIEGLTWPPTNADTHVTGRVSNYDWEHGLVPAEGVTASINVGGEIFSGTTDATGTFFICYDADRDSIPDFLPAGERIAISTGDGDAIVEHMYDTVRDVTPPRPVTLAEPTIQAGVRVISGLSEETGATIRMRINGDWLGVTGLLTDGTIGNNDPDLYTVTVVANGSWSF